MLLKSTSFEFFAKIMGENYFFYVNPACHLNRYLTNTYTIIPYLTNPNQYLPIFNCYLPIGYGVEIYNLLNSAEIVSANKKAANKKYSKIVRCCIDDCTIVYIVQRIILVKPDFNLIQQTLTL